MPLAELNDLGTVDVVAELWQADAVKLVVGARYDAKRCVWTVPLAWPQCLQLRAIFLKELTVGPRLAAWSRDYCRRVVEASLAARKLMDGPGDPSSFPHVRAGGNWLRIVGDALLLDEMGGGKTHQAVDAMRAAGGESLVVTTNSMLWTWRDEAELWWPGVRVSIVTGTAGQRRKAIEADADVYVIAWHNLWRHSRLAKYGSCRLSTAERTPKELNARAWSVVVADEVHRARKPEAKVTRALWAVGDPAGQRIGLTGTPVEQNVDDLWSLLRFVAPYEWESGHIKYKERYCDTSWTGWGMDVVGLKPANQIEFRRATDYRWRRVPADVFRGERPETVYQTVPLEMGRAQRDQYKALLADQEMEPLTKVTRAWQLASSCLTPDWEPIEPSCKVDAVREILDDYPGQVVVFSSHRRLLELLIPHLKEDEWGAVMGGPFARDRARHLKAFLAGDKRVMLCTYGAGSEGIHLYTAQLMVTMQDTWMNLEAQQAVARLDRPGQVGGVLVKHLETRGTIDRRVSRVRQQKGFQLEQFVQDRERLAELLEEGEE